ncbi:MAG TPA: isoprenylcysteine carboxylmethyltransferase family protein [Planctomycetota bacterium]|nr:isoprenylcysteine carboxylmethyltransferase family protein [Planctomycetota bacterium]
MTTPTESPRSAHAIRTCLAAAAPADSQPAPSRWHLMGLQALPGAPVAASSAHRVGILVYGLLCYALCLATFAYAFGYLGNILTPTRLDAPAAGPTGPALLVDLALLLAFAVQHSVMARPWFKAWITRYIPQPAERPTYVLLSCLLMGALFVAWRPLGGVVWDVQSPLARGVVLAVYGAGWALLLASTFLINHFDLFGVRQTWLHFRGWACTHLPFATPGLYGMVRHPLYVGWFIVFWAAPTMTAAHLLFASVCTLYILAAIRWEERDLVALHPEYAAHRERVPMFLPRLR